VEFQNRPRVTVTELHAIPTQRKTPPLPAAATIEDNTLTQRLLNDPPPKQRNSTQNASDSRYGTSLLCTETKNLIDFNQVCPFDNCLFFAV
jgi:uncharacterized FlgJ-related protein